MLAKYRFSTVHVLGIYRVELVPGITIMAAMVLVRQSILH